MRFDVAIILFCCQTLSRNPSALGAVIDYSRMLSTGCVPRKNNSLILLIMHAYVDSSL